jgi:hypothetical protein
MSWDGRYGTARPDVISAVLADHNKLSAFSRHGLMKILGECAKVNSFNKLRGLQWSLEWRAGRQELVPGLGRVGLTRLAISKYKTPPKWQRGNISRQRI